MSVPSVALESITAIYTDSESEDGLDDEQEDSNTPKGSAPRNDLYSQSEDNSPRSDRSESNSSNSASTVGRKNNNVQNAPTLVTDVTTKVQRLVSYFDDTVVSDDEGSISGVTKLVSSLNGKSASDTANQQSPDQDLISDGETDMYGVIIPSNPPGACPAELQEKIKNLYKKMESGRLDMNEVIQRRKDFRNPSIYEKLIQFCSINELGTNYPPDRFDPFKWSKESYYDELAKSQKVEMEKLEKARKEKTLRKETTKIEIVSGTAKRPSNTTATAEEEAKKRKSKWDQISSNPTAAVAAAVVKPGIIAPPTLTTLTASVTGTKATVISAFGSLPKKRL